MNKLGRMRVARAGIVVAWLASAGCDPYDCENEESFVVDEIGTCASTPQQFTIEAISCRVRVYADMALTGLPASGTLGQEQRPLRQGGFMLFTQDAAQFRLCRARRVEYRLELACVDDTGAPVCDATLTEPAANLTQ